MIRRRLVLLLALAATGAAGGPAAFGVSPAEARLVARLYAPGHHPRANRAWPIRITARSPSGRAVKADVRYEYLYGGQVVARRSHYTFRGTFRDNIVWPSRSIGIRLTFRAVVHSSIGTRRLDYWVRVVR